MPDQIQPAVSGPNHNQADTPNVAHIIHDEDINRSRCGAPLPYMPAPWDWPTCPECEARGEVSS